MAHLELVALIVRDYDSAIHFFVDVLGFELVEDVPALTNDGRAKRWVVVRPMGGQTGVLLARADGDRQASVVGQQFAGRVGLFFRVDDFDAAYERMIAAGVTFVSAPRVESYGRLAVFLDLEGNRWDLLGPHPSTATSIDSKDAPEHAVRAVTAALVRAVNTADVDAVMTVWDENGSLMPPHHPAVLGHAAIRAYFERLFGQRRFTFVFERSDVRVEGGTAIECVRYSASVEALHGGATHTDRGKGVHVYRRAPDGSWKLAIDIWNSDVV